MIHLSDIRNELFKLSSTVLNEVCKELISSDGRSQRSGVELNTESRSRSIIEVEC